MRRLLVCAAVVCACPVQAQVSSYPQTGSTFNGGTISGQLNINATDASTPFRVLSSPSDGWGNFNFVYDETIFPDDLTRACKTYRWGYNVGPGATNVVPNDVGFHWEIESYFALGASKYIEAHWEYTHPANAKVIRVVSTMIDRETDSTTLSFASDNLMFYDASSEALAFKIIDSTAFTVYSGKYFLGLNNENWLKQQNASGIAIPLTYIDSSNVVQLSGDTSNIAGLNAPHELSYSLQTLSIADSGGAGAATGTLTAVKSYAVCSCADADGCDVTMGETGARAGTVLTITNLGANVCNFADTAGVTELAGALAMGQYDSLSLLYATDRWVETARSNN